jgi:hypothetical protein
MKIRNKITIIVLLFVLNGCENIWLTLTGENNTCTIIIDPNGTLPNDTIEPGTLIYMKKGSHIYKDKIIAQGTREKPIVFRYYSDTVEDVGSIIGTINPESIFEYCEFININIYLTDTIKPIQHCKFTNSYLRVNDNYPEQIVQYNTFNDSLIVVGNYNFSSSVGYYYYGSVSFLYNIIDGSGEMGYGIFFYNGSLYADNNNITNISGYAIYNGSDMLYPGYSGLYEAKSNYIANCNGLIGTDTTGEQCRGITYTNPQTSPVPGTGCGW